MCRDLRGKAKDRDEHPDVLNTPLHVSLSLGMSKLEIYERMARRGMQCHQMEHQSANGSHHWNWPFVDAHQILLPKLNNVDDQKEAQRKDHIVDLNTYANAVN